MMKREIRYFGWDGAAWAWNIAVPEHHWNEVEREFAAMLDAVDSDENNAAVIPMFGERWCNTESRFQKMIYYAGDPAVRDCVQNSRYRPPFLTSK